MSAVAAAISPCAPVSAPATYRELLKTGRWFAGLPQALQDQLLARATVRTFAKRRTVIRAWQPSPGLFGLIGGRVLVRTRLDEQCEPMVRMAFDSPSWIGEQGLLDPAAPPLGIDVVADVDTEAVFIANADLRALLAQHPAYWQHIAALGGHHMRMMLTAAIDREHDDPEARVARRLVWMARGHGDYVSHYRVISVSQASLAMMVDQSRQTLNTHLKALERKRLINIGYCSIEILDAEGLLTTLSR